VLVFCLFINYATPPPHRRSKLLRFCVGGGEHHDFIKGGEGERREEGRFFLE